MKTKQTVGRAFIALVGLFSVSFVGAATLRVAPVSALECGGAKTSIIECNAKNSKSKGVEDNGVWALLLIFINILTAGVGVVAVIGIIYGSVLYTTAEDKADQVKKATDIITNVVIGLIMFALMWSALNFLVPGGVFTQ